MKESLFQKIDEATFKGVDSLKSTAQFSQFASSIESLPELGQKFVNQTLTYLVSFFPLVFLLVGFLSTCTMRSNIEDREELLEKVSTINNYEKKLSRYASELVAPLAILTETDLKAQLSSLAGSIGSSPSSLRVLDYGSEKFGELIETGAVISFKNLSTPKLTAILDYFLVQQRSKLKDFKLKKIGKSLQGELKILHYSRSSSGTDNVGPK